MSRLLLLLWIMLVLTACGSPDDKNFNRYIHQIKSRPPARIDPIPHLAPIIGVTFDKKTRHKNPFIPRQNDSPHPHRHRLKDPLEHFPLQSLTFVGILQSESIVWGLIKQPDGQISPAKPGEHIGDGDGFIVSINDSAMQIEESVQCDGQWEKKHITLSLHDA